MNFTMKNVLNVYVYFQSNTFFFVLESYYLRLVKQLRKWGHGTTKSILKTVRKTAF